MTGLVPAPATSLAPVLTAGRGYDLAQGQGDRGQGRDGTGQPRGEVGRDLGGLGSLRHCPRGTKDKERYYLFIYLKILIYRVTG